jgi:ribosomal protein S14
MQYEGVLKKMQTEIGNPIQYYMLFESDFLNVNQVLNKTLKIEFIKFQCLNCGNDRPIYRQGFCRTCFFEIPSAGDWIMRPELSKAHLDQEDRDLAYEKKVQLQPHIVYLANSSNVKVGVTRKGQIPTRWIDQGAHEAIEIVEVPNRYLAGITEVALKDHVGDKTNWRTMLTNNVVDQNLKDWRDKLKKYIPEEALPYYLESNLETELEFPVLQYPTKVKSLNLSKTPSFEGTLKGIKGQYLIFEDNTVFNVRGSEGYFVGLTVN